MCNTKIVGILNITPDSFSDGGRYATKEAAIARIQALNEEGADMIDIGAESTRPGALPLTAAEEWQRLEPVLHSLRQFPSMRFSLDSRHAENVSKALAMGMIACVNDVSGFANAAMVDAVKSSGCQLVVMHSLTVPADKSVVMPESVDVVEALIDFARGRIASLEKQGIERSRIVFDPGIGFGKTAAQSRQIIDGIERFKIVGVPLYYGHSRKSFLAGNDRDAATLAVSRFLIEHGAGYIRVHDVAAHRKLMGRRHAY